MIKTVITNLCMLLGCAAAAQSYVSPFNKLPVNIQADSAYRFIVSGHFYGNSTGGSTGYPASTVLGGIGIIRSAKPNVLLTTGDMFIDSKADFERYSWSLFQPLGIPVVNTVGNHDLDGGYYQDLYGATYFSVPLGADRLLVLDTERDDSSIKGAQLALLEQTAQAVEAGQVRHVFILTHRPVWAEAIPTYGKLFQNNTRSVFTNNFNDEVLPILSRIAARTSVYWFSGSIGGAGKSSIFFSEHKPGLFFVQSAVRDRMQDAVLVADVTQSGVQFTSLSLTGSGVKAPQDMGVAFWTNEEIDIAPTMRLIPYYITSMLKHRYFWYGAALAGLIIVALRRIYRRWV